MAFNEAQQNLHWILVNSINQAGRENLKLKPKVITEGYLLLPDNKLQHALQICDIDTITPEALWIGTFQEAIEVIANYKKLTEINCTILKLPHNLVKKESGKIKLNFRTLNNDFITELLKTQENTVKTVKENKEETPTQNRFNSIQIFREDDKLLQATIADYFLNEQNIKKILLFPRNKLSGVTIYYKKDGDEPPNVVLDKIFDYKCIWFRGPVKLPRGWRSLCSLKEYTDMLDREFRRIKPQYRSVAWSEKILDEIFNNDPHNLFPSITSDILTKMITYSEIMQESRW